MKVYRIDNLFYLGRKHEGLVFVECNSEKYEDIYTAVRIWCKNNLPTRYDGNWPAVRFSKWTYVGDKVPPEKKQTIGEWIWNHFGL